MFRDIGDKFGLIQAQIGVAKCLAQCKRFRDSMNSYQLAVTSCHETDNKVGSPTKAFFSDWCFELRLWLADTHRESILLAERARELESIWNPFISFLTDLIIIFQSYEIKIYEDLIAINKFHGSDDAIQRFTKLREDAIQQMNVRCGYCLEYIGGKVVKLEENGLKERNRLPWY